MATLEQDTGRERRVMNRTIFAKVGAVAYVIWGLLHLLAAWSVYTVSWSMPSGMESGRVLQPTPLGLHIVMGPQFAEMAANLGRNLQEGRVRLVQAIMARA